MANGLGRAAVRARRVRAYAVGGAIVALVVLLFTCGWHDGRTTLDGDGVVLYVDIGLQYWRQLGHIPYFIPNMWDGTPVWALAPIFPVLYLLPLARFVGPEAAVRYATVGLQIVGGWGAMTLAWSLWKDDGAQQASAWASAVVAGCLYALNPIVISHGTLFGHETTIAVLAAAPWLVWALRRGLRGEGTGWLIVTGLLAATAILDQAEHAYALVIICALVTVAQAVRVGWRPVLVRATAVVAVIVGILAHWLVPLKALTSAFILSPPDVVSSSLTAGIGAQIGNEPGTFLHRGPGLARVVTYDHPDILRAGSFYLGWVWLIGAAIALVILAVRPRRDGDATLSALLLAAAVCVWMSTAATPLARSGPGLRHEWLALAIVGAIGGLCAGVFIRRVCTGRVAMAAAGAGVVVLFAAPYVTPFLVLQHFIPLAGDLRLPRLYPLAALGLSLAAAYPISLIGGSYRPTRLVEVRTVQLMALTAAVLLVGLAMVDIWPYRTFYRTRGPADSAAYQAAAKVLPPGRVTTAAFGDPRVVNALVDTGHPLVTGWPHPIAEKGLWNLAVTPEEASPDGYRDAAAALAGATSEVVENDIVPLVPVDLPDQAALSHLVSNPNYPAPDVPANAVQVKPIPSSLPIVRAYDQAVVVQPSSNSALDPATELAVDLESNHVSVVQGGPATARTLGPLALGGGPQPASCASFGAESGGPVLNDELALACALHRWIGRYVGLGVTLLGKGIGGEFTAAAGLSGVALWLVGPSGGVQVQLRPVRPDGALGPPIGTTGPGAPDANGLIPFAFPSQPAGTYAFIATCPGCAADAQPSLVFTEAKGQGDMIATNHLVTDLVVDFAPIYPLPPAAPASSATLTVVQHGEGSWDIEVKASRPQLVVVAESNFPGWRASIDGKAAPVVGADVAFVGVPVPVGTHRLVLHYRAPGVTLGDWITVLTLLICLGVVLRPRWPRIRDALPTAWPAQKSATYR